MTEEIRLRANGIQFRALAAGPAGGEPVLLLHGFPEGAESWLPQLDALAAAGFRAVAPDLRGYGGTDCPEGEESYRVEALVGDVLGLLDVIGAPAHVAGHDWGSLLGWVFTGLHPARVRTWTALSVGHPAAFANPDPNQRERSRYIRLFWERGKAEEVLAADGWRRLRAIYGGAFPEDVVERYVSGFARPGRLTAALDYYRAALPELPRVARPVGVPSILVWGDRDPALGETQARLTAGFVAGAPYQLHVLEGAGHWLQYERPAQVSSLLVAHCQGVQRG
jgi:pimeloyl-ACP methyl ester carboxylesterase